MVIETENVENVQNREIEILGRNWKFGTIWRYVEIGIGIVN